MAKIKGVCHNYDGCDKAADKIVQEAEKSNFVCEECGKPLYPVKDGGKKTPGDGKRIATLIAIFGGAALVIGGIVYGIIFGVQKSRENAELERIEAARQDSIRAAEAAEAARLDSIKAAEEAAAAVEQARLDSIAEAEAAAAAEQARLDSIAAAEEAAKAEKARLNAEAQKARRLGYGKWSGAWKNGQPNGTGTMTYTKEHLIDSRDPKQRVAQPGDYIIGEFSNGRLVQGKWFDAFNNVKGSIIIGK